MQIYNAHSPSPPKMPIGVQFINMSFYKQYLKLIKLDSALNPAIKYSVEVIHEALNPIAIYIEIDLNMFCCIKK